MATLRQVTAALEDAIEQVVRDLGVNITADLVETTPVDIGWARANWVPGLGRPGASSTERADDASQVGGARGNQTAAIGSIQTFTLSVGNLYITNNVPYIVRLNEGSSTQAPAGFVQQSIQKEVNNLGG